MRALLLYVSLSLLTGCNTANLVMANVETRQGLLNLNNVRLGYLFIWDRKNAQIRRIDILDRPHSELYADSRGFDLDISVEGGAEFVGNIDLTEAEIDVVETEASRRSSFETRNLQTVAIRNPVGSIVSALNSDPTHYIDSLEIRDVVNSGGELLYVLVSEIGLTESTELLTDRKISAGATFDVQGIGGGLKFKLVDAGKLRFGGRNGQLAPTFVRYSILQPSWSATNTVKFATVTSVDLAELQRLINEGNF